MLYNYTPTRMLKYIVIACILVGTVNLTDISFYEILGVTKEATSQEIRQAYKKLAIKLHPDKNPGAGNQEKFLKITEAYETLKDPDKKYKYDMYGSYPTYGRKYDFRSQAEYDNMYYNGLYHEDPNVDTLSGNSFYTYLKEGFHFINFYSPFCPPCQKVAGHWKKLAEMYKGVVKVGAVNCKYHNSFCYNSMRISSYPTLILYTDGKDGNFIYYRGDRTIDALDAFVMKYLRSKVHIPTVTYILDTERPIAYVLGENRIGASALARIAFQLNGLATMVLVEDDSLRAKLCNEDHVTVVFKYKGVSRTISSTDEKDVLQGIVKHLPKVEVIDPKKLQTYRQNLRSGSVTPWVLYFSAGGSDSLEFHQKRLAMPDLNFGEINCEEWSELCAALQVDTLPSWGVMKRGGAYQRVNPRDIQLAVQATNLHTLSLSEFIRTLQQETGVWVLLVVPHKMSWDDALEPFTRASIHFKHSDVQFGIMSCTESTNQHCRRVSYDEPTVFVQNGTRRTYHGGTELHGLVQFIQMLKDSADMEITEEQVMEIIDVSSRSHVWFIAHMPAHCGRYCDQLAGEWMQVYTKLRPLEFVRVGILRCESDTVGFCANIRMPTARLYPLGSPHYSVNLQQVNQATYLLEWALERITDSVQKLNWNMFSKTVIAEELNPSSAVKPWLVYFHSPRCYRCYEMFPEFAIAGIKLGNAVHLGRVNCLTERNLCQHEGITSYPSLRLYLSRSARRVSSIVTVQVRDWNTVLADVNRHLNEFTGSVGVHAKHDEF